MSLFTSSSNVNRTSIPFLLGVITFVLINVCVEWLPYGVYKKMFDSSLYKTKEVGESAEVLLFGDSRATRLNHAFFDRNTLSCACANNTIIYSDLLYDQIIETTDCRPKVLIITLGANNYGKNSIFTKRDFAIRRLASFSDLIKFRSYKDGFGYTVDGLFAKFAPIYGRRLEIRSPTLIKSLLTQRSESKALPGMELLNPGVLKLKNERDHVGDVNYRLIYERSIYANYKLSWLHVGILELLIDKAIINNTFVVLVQLPIEQDILDLQNKLVRNEFDEVLDNLAQKGNVIRLDMRTAKKYEMTDNNHMSYKGSQQFVSDNLNPLIESLIVGSEKTK